MTTQLRQRDRVQRALGGQVKLRSLIQNYRRNLRAYSSEYPKLIEKHLHSWVAFDNAKRIGIDPSYEALLDRIGGFEKISAAAIVRYIEEPGKAHFH